MKWWIVEESLQGRQGHWFDYLKGFHDDLPRLGDEVAVFVSQKAEPFIREQMAGRSLLPESIFLQFGDDASRWRRYLRVPSHALKVRRAIKNILRTTPAPRVAFVPTVTVHHLLAWTMLLKQGGWPRGSTVLLFFPGLPLVNDGTGVRLDGSPTARLMRWLFRRLRPEIAADRVVLGVETEAMRAAANAAFGVPFTYFPHPVTVADASPGSHDALVFGAYGPARHEKGGDILVAAIEHYLQQPDGKATFVVQWTNDFAAAGGETKRIPPSLRQHPRVEIVDRLFRDGEYLQRLARTDALLLPYRRSAYGLRVSRMMVEAVVRGLPVLTTQHTTLHEQMHRFGAGIDCQEDDVASVTAAIAEIERRFTALQAAARARREAARDHFSVRTFRTLLQSTLTRP